MKDESGLGIKMPSGKWWAREIPILIKKIKTKKKLRVSNASVLKIKV